MNNLPYYSMSGSNAPISSAFESFTTMLLIILLIIMTIAFVLAREFLTAHWNHLLKGLSYSPQEFYKLLSEEINQEEIDGIIITIETLPIKGFMSARRQYARITWGDFSFIVCAAPFAKSFFISYRTQEQADRWRSAFSAIPWVGKYITRLFTISWYREDTIIMFHKLVHQSIVQVTNKIAESNNLPKLTQEQSTPIMRDLFKRAN